MSNKSKNETKLTSKKVVETEQNNSRGNEQLTPSVNKPLKKKEKIQDSDNDKCKTGKLKIESDESDEEYSSADENVSVQKKEDKQTKEDKQELESMLCGVKKLSVDDASGEKHDDHFECLLNTREGWWSIKYLIEIEDKMVYQVNKQFGTKKLLKVGDKITFRNLGDYYAGIAVDGGHQSKSIYLTGPSFKDTKKPFYFNIKSNGLVREVHIFSSELRNSHPNVYHWNDCRTIE